ncbi:MAG: hypothetical protein ABSG86_11975 [Thermoguttaceae bacterium]|jgi:hypothetical protein
MKVLQQLAVKAVVGLVVFAAANLVWGQYTLPFTWTFSGGTADGARFTTNSTNATT